ncbi:MAG: hypothetical protein LLG06_20060 [Desulfobacteraceae bacterium]|nr:hypothetical protein [Desulfobacteraceae bacterium]
MFQKGLNVYGMSFLVPHVVNGPFSKGVLELCITNLVLDLLKIAERHILFALGQIRRNPVNLFLGPFNRTFFTGPAVHTFQRLERLVRLE